MNARLLGAGLAGRGVVCTGGAGAIGRAVCHEFAQAGARVLVVDRDAADCAGVVAALPGDGHDAFAADLSDLGVLDALPAAAAERVGSCDVLVHMAAVLRRRPIPAVTAEDWDRQLDINLKTTFFLARATAEHMRGSGTPGRIVLFASQAWWTGGYGSSLVYAASKGGVVSLVRGLAREYGPAGITVNAVAPGSVDTPMLRTDLSDEVLEEVLRATPLRRLGSAAEIATATVFLASANASFVSGTTLNVSGGWLNY